MSHLTSIFKISGVMLVSITLILALKGSAAEPAKVIVVVNLQEKDFVSRTGVLLRKRNIPVAGFDFKTAFTQELMDRLAADKRMQYRLATAEDGIPALPISGGRIPLPAKAYKASVPANLDASRILRVDIEALGASTVMGLTYYNIVGTMVMLNRQGKVLWQQRNYIGDNSMFPDWQIKVSGNVDEHQADNQKLMKENINKIIEKYCASKVDKILNKEFKD
jgi:hypothetical protein